MDDLFQLFIFFVQRPESVVKLKSLVGLGFFLQRYGQYLVRDTVRQLYHTYLLDRRPAAAQLRCQVLINLEEYFRDCIRRMAEQDVDYLQLTTTTTNPPTINNEDENSNEATGPTGANLKDTTDVHSEMASSIAQCYLRVVLDTYLSEDETIRQCVRKVVTCILEQGLVHPVQFIPYLIAMTTDRDTNIQQSAEQNLQDLDKTNPGIIQTKVMHGLKMSYQLQKLLAIANNKKDNQQSNSHFDIIRGNYDNRRFAAIRDPNRRSIALITLRMKCAGRSQRVSNSSALPVHSEFWRSLMSGFDIRAFRPLSF